MLVPGLCEGSGQWCRVVQWLRAGIESVTDYYCNAEGLYTEEVTKNRTGN